MKNFMLWMSSIIAVTVIYHICYGLQTLVPTNVSWLMTALHDWGTHYLGWAFYKSEPWHFPLGDVHNYYYPVGTNVGYTDSIPLLALFFKLFAPILPDDFQYFGLWLFMCHLLTAVYSILLLRLFGMRHLYIFLSVILLVANPVLVYRGLHPALCAQWVLIASVYFYFLPAEKATKVLIYQFILLMISALINPYICFMTLGFSMAIPVRLWRYDRTLPLKRLIVYVGSSFAGILVLWYITGLLSFEKKENMGVEGSYGLYGLNLNSLYNSSGFSSWFPSLKQVSWHQYEGFMYLGAGFFFLILLLLVYGTFLLASKKLTLRPRYKARNISLLPLLVLLTAYTLFAVTHIVSLNDKVLFRVPVPPVFVKWGEIFRASARFFWGPYYIILIVVLIAVARARIANGVRSGILVLAVLIQVYDTNLLLTFRNLSSGEYEPPLTNATWKQLIGQSDKIVMYPPFQASYLTNMDYQFFSYLAAKAKKPISTGYVARANNDAVAKFTDSISVIDSARISPHALYITTEQYLDRFYPALHNKFLSLVVVDNYYVFSTHQWNFASGYSSKVDSLLNSLKERTTPMEMSKPAVQPGGMRFWIEGFNETTRDFSINGWAFTDTANSNKGDSIFILLEGDESCYSIKADMHARPDLTSGYRRSYLDDAGFSARAFKETLRKGNYKLSILIRRNNGQQIYQPVDSSITTSFAKFFVPERLTSLPRQADIIYGIDEFSQDTAFLKIDGWAAFQGQDADNCEIRLALKSEQIIYSIPVKERLRPDVASARKEYKLEKTGFDTKVSKADLPKGQYKLAIIIRDKKSKREGYIFTDKLITIL